MFPWSPLYFLQVSCPIDYRLWLQSMYVLFGTKWLKLHCGPMLNYAPIMQSSAAMPDDSQFHQSKHDLEHEMIFNAAYLLLII